MACRCCMRLALLALLGVAVVSANTFLEKAPEPVPDPFDQVALLDRFEEALGSGQRQATEARLKDITEALAHTFATLPKNERGAVGTAGARYAIHRLFVQRHGWQVQGVAPEGETWSSSSPVAALGEGVPGHVQDLLDKRFGSHGLDLHELAVLAATLENMIHAEAIQSLEATYKVYGESTEGMLDEASTERIVDSYMQAYVLGHNMSELTRQMVDRTYSRMDRILPLWQQTREFLRDVQREVAPGLSAFSFADVTRIVEAVSERYGQHQDSVECEDIQQKLLQLEEVGGTGRVKLHDFYASVRKHRFWQFREHPEFLKQAGVLDDSDPSSPRVIIPNYFNMPSNCFNPPTALYAICCIDKCEALIDHVESEIQAPHATPERIVRVVSALPSASVPANRTLHQELVARLERVAQQHDGVVPLHGRLFSQWMHFAYPRECPYPHAAGTTKLMSSEEWSQATGMKVSLMLADLERYVEQLHPVTEPTDWWQQQHGQHQVPPQHACDEETGTCMAMWQDVEELVDAGHWDITRKAKQQAEGASSVGTVMLRALMLLAFVASSVMAIGGFVQQAHESFSAALTSESACMKPALSKSMNCFV
mmetsp:Transcript_9107/g.24774  ORF Transcript_9107/g.24774 Transcript_9107/m.24774 type:complete len:597 (+) Transcript_9107:70-1860(+)